MDKVQEMNKQKQKFEQQNEKLKQKLAYSKVKEERDKLLKAQE